jgi:hypothetical protein
MALIPTERPAIVGVSKITIWPWAGASGPYDDTTACVLEGLQHLEDVSTIKNAVVKGGESPDPLAGFMVDRESKIKVSAEKCDLRLRQILQGGTFATDAATGGGGNEVQYYAPDLDKRSTYFRLGAETTTGDGMGILTFFKCKLEGNLSAKLEREKITDIEFEFMPFKDAVAVRKDGTTGGIYEYEWRQDPDTAFTS